MTRSLLTTTNKARIWRNDDGTVEKEYFDLSRARGEYEKLRQIEEEFGPPVANEGWTYSVARVIEFEESRGGIRMEFAAGFTLAEAASFNPSVVRHLGRWLGLYHARSVDNNGCVRLYSDVSVYNFLLDTFERTVVAIDPGLAAGRRAAKEIDVLMGVASVVNLAVKLRSRPSPVVTAYLRGYRSTGPPPRFTGELFDAAATEVVAHYREKAMHEPGLRRLDARMKAVLLGWYLSHAVAPINQSLVADD